MTKGRVGGLAGYGYDQVFPKDPAEPIDRPYPLDDVLRSYIVIDGFELGRITGARVDALSSRRYGYTTDWHWVTKDGVSGGPFITRHAATVALVDHVKGRSKEEHHG